MIDLRSEEHASLRRVSAAGRSGVQLGAVPASHAIRFGLLRLAEITTERPQRVIITPMGSAFLLRGAA